ncbi:MAG: metallophosphoesterase [Bacteroidales bacterium]|nr:metallophosphoesterase [Bacteroidales bacterium]
MDRREFFRFSALGLAGLTLGDRLTQAEACSRKDAYSVVILGDTHFDTAPEELYHSGYYDPSPTREANHRKEWVRNCEMWEDRCPRLVKRAAALADKNTRMFFQVGDLIQGDTGNIESHQRFLGDVMTKIKGMLGSLPFVTVIGNHDLRAAADDSYGYQAYREYMPGRMAAELGQEVDSTNFAFRIDKDAYIVVDFCKPNDVEVERLLKETEGARYTFVLCHAPFFPYNSKKYYNWYYHGRDKDKTARNRMLGLFAKRDAIVLCGHTHSTEFMDWYGMGGHITQMTMSSVWAKEEIGHYKPDLEGAEQYGVKSDMTYKKEAFDEFRDGIRSYSSTYCAGSYKLNVSDKGVTVDFYAGDSKKVSKTFVLR